jgi:hypothetical protein
MNDAAEQLGEQVGKVLIPVALLIWGAHKCQQMSERRGVNRDAVRGLMIALGGWAVALIGSPFVALLPRVMAIGGLALVLLTCVAGAALSVKGLLAASEYSEGTLQGVLGVLAGLGVTALLGFGFASGVRGPDRTSVAFLSKVATVASRSLPRALDDATMFTSVTAQPSRLVYSYRLIRHSAAQIDHDKFATALKPQLVTKSCQQAEVRALLDAGVTLAHEYADKDGAPVAKVEIVKLDCPAS